MAQQVRVLQDFEQAGDLRLWEFRQKSATLSDQHATSGRQSLRVSANEYLNSFRLPRDWSGFDSLDIDMFVEGDSPVAGTLLIADEAWQQKGGSYWNLHNGSFTLRPGANVVSIPVNGLYRGEAGSRNNDIKSNIIPSQIIRVDLGFKTKGDPAGAIYLDHLRLVREARPAGILAFDFGPESQVLFPGFTPISNTTLHGKDGARAGLRQAMSGFGAARDDTFPTRLYQDYLALDWNEFLADVPNGRYHVWVVYDDCGYWGGEAAVFSKRWIESGAQTVWQEDRGAAGPLDYLYRFENVEPKPGDSVWDLYVGRLFEPKRFTVEVTGGRLSLRFRAEGANACKVAAVIVYPDDLRSEAEAWVKQVEERNRREFESRAVFLGPVAKPLEIPAAARQQGYWLGFPALEEDVTLVDAPGRSEGRLARPAALGQRVSLTFALRPLKELAGPVKLAVTDLKGPGGEIPAREIDLRYVHHATHRGFNDIAYTIGPETLRPVAGSALRLAKDLTRQFWVTVPVPPNAKAGDYAGELTLSAGEWQIRLPLSVSVLGYPLDEPDYLMGFYGTHLPGEIRDRQGGRAWRELLTAIRQGGMNSYSGGPGVRFSGLDADGKPRLDFAACDEFFRIARECGFTREVNGYGGPGMVQGLHDGYVIGQTGRDWEKKTGKTFGQLLQLVWGAVREHAARENWPRVQHGFTDEPRVLAEAEKQLELMRAYREHVPFVNIGGSYSVKWNNDPLELAIQEIFKTLCWSALNVHTATDLARAKEFGRELLIYNQGVTRYSFGAYQWAELHKGIRGRMQWHLLALHGYQFFDLDGREPDTAMINWGREGILPTLRLPRCREGADDLRFAVTLWNLALKRQGNPAAGEARQWLEQVSQAIALNQNRRPAGFMNDEAFRAGCIGRIARLRD